MRLTSPPSRGECHEIWEPKPPGTPLPLPLTCLIVIENRVRRHEQPECVGGGRSVINHSPSRYLSRSIIKVCVAVKRAVLFGLQPSNPFQWQGAYFLLVAK